MASIRAGHLVFCETPARIREDPLGMAQGFVDRLHDAGEELGVVVAAEEAAGFDLRLPATGW